MCRARAFQERPRLLTPDVPKVAGAGADVHGETCSENQRWMLALSSLPFLGGERKEKLGQKDGHTSLPRLQESTSISLRISLPFLSAQLASFLTPHSLKKLVLHVVLQS